MPALTKENARALLPQYDLDDSQLDIMVQIVEGWLLEDTGLEDLPPELPKPLWAGAVELLALLASNPESLAQKTIGPTSRAWPMAPQRDAIRARVRARYRALRMAPQGGYPAPQVYPEPARGGAHVPVSSHPEVWVVDRW